MTNAFTCTEDLLRSLAQPIAIVGNGVPVGPMGAAIDHHPSVIRLNNYRLSGHEALVGTRTSVRCTSGWQDIEVRSDLAEFSPFTRGAPESSAVASYEERSARSLVCARTDVHALLPQVPNPSTGLALAALCSHLGLEFSLFGFDGFASGHYWNPGQPLATTHSARERDLLLTLPHGVLYGHSYDYASLYNFCHAEHAGYNVNEGLSLYRQLGVVIEGESILEFGAGNGELSVCMQSQGNDVTAIEVSQVAFDRIAIRQKIRGDCMTLAGLQRRFDRFVSVDVLEHLTENDIRIVVREAARLAGSVFVSVSTRLSGLLGPNGENLHLTVRSVEWWHELFAEHFDVELIGGLEVGQVILAGDRRAVGVARAARPAAPPDRFDLPAAYTARAKPTYYLDVADDGVTWQPDVYPAAADIARSLDCDTLIDIGCGHARKLSALHPEFKLIGVDYGKNIEHCRARFPFGTWLEADFENIDLLPLPARVLKNAVIVCSDVIEHLVDPRSLVRALHRLLKDAPALVLSTPDRERTWGTAHMGPPPNAAHTREWSLPELRTLLEREGFSLAAATHTRSNDSSPDRATIMMVAVNPDHPMIRASRTQPPTAAAGQAATAAPPVVPSMATKSVGATVQGSTRAERPATVVSAETLQAATAAAGAQAMADPTWRERLGRARDDRETLRVLARMSLELGHPTRSMDLYGALLGADRADNDALEGVVLSQIRCGQHAAAARVLASVRNP
jgi:2-polyprenyl-3-methyl-5-hydroxy-6-metoxy-1,4-benzoquinol methylase